jgi:hypothetical protein
MKFKKEIEQILYIIDVLDVYEADSSPVPNAKADEATKEPERTQAQEINTEINASASSIAHPEASPYPETPPAPVPPPLPETTTTATNEVPAEPAAPAATENHENVPPQTDENSEK